TSARHVDCATVLGGSGEDPPLAIDTAAAGDTYRAGYTSSTDFPVTPGAYRTTAPPDANVFVTKLGPAGTPIFFTYSGGSDFDNAFALHVDVAGDVYVTGATISTDFPVTAGVVQAANAGGADAFVAELDPSGAHLLASTYLGGMLPD